MIAEIEVRFKAVIFAVKYKRADAQTFKKKASDDNHKHCFDFFFLNLTKK